MLSQLKTSVLMLAVFSVLTGVAYPLVITGIAQAVFPRQANGSLILQDGMPVGSELIGQPFDDPKYFWGRPSATTPFPYNAASSSGGNLAVTNPSQTEAMEKRAELLRLAGTGAELPIPIDLITASASGLDPHMSVAAAQYQVDRVARARGMNPVSIMRMLDHATENRQLGILGERRVNVLLLNLELDRTAGSSGDQKAKQEE